MLEISARTLRQVEKIERIQIAKEVVSASLIADAMTLHIKDAKNFLYHMS